jgi:hypothetical protein
VIAIKGNCFATENTQQYIYVIELIEPLKCAAKG